MLTEAFSHTSASSRNDTTVDNPNKQTQPCRDTAAWLFSFREAYAHTFVRESFRIAGIHYFVPKMASRLSERAALQTTPLPRVTIRPHLSACVSRLSVLEDNRDNGDNGLILNTMLSDDNNKYNFYQPKGWLPLEICCPSCLCCLPKTARELLSKRTIVFVE